MYHCSTFSTLLSQGRVHSLCFTHTCNYCNGRICKIFKKKNIKNTYYVKNRPILAIFCHIMYYLRIVKRTSPLIIVVK